MFIIIPRSILEVAGYVGVANYAIGRADLVLGGIAGGLKKTGDGGDNDLTADNLRTAINTKGEVKEAIAALVKAQCGGAVVAGPDGSKEITAAEDGTQGTLKVELQPASSGTGDQIANGTSGEVTVDGLGGTSGVKVTIKISKKDGEQGSLKPKSSGTDNNNDAEAEKIAKKIKEAAEQGAFRDFNAFVFIAAHDMLAMFCRFFYGKLAVGYN